MYNVVYSDRAEEDLKLIDKATARKIMDRVKNYLAQNPKSLGEPLKGDFSGYWRYRWGDYRVIYMIAEEEILIVVLQVGHRKEIYN